MTEKVSVRTGAGVTKMPRAEAVLHKVFELALKGNSRAQSQLLSLYDAAVPDASIDTSGGEVDDREHRLRVLQDLTTEYLRRGIAAK